MILLNLLTYFNLVFPLSLNVTYIMTLHYFCPGSKMSTLERIRAKHGIRPRKNSVDVKLEASQEDSDEYLMSGNLIDMSDEETKQEPEFRKMKITDDYISR